MNKQILFILLMLISVFKIFANDIIELTSEEEKQSLALRDMLWQEKLNEKQIRILKLALKSKKDMVLVEAVKVITIHRLNSFSKQFEKGIHGIAFGYGEQLGKQISIFFKKDKKKPLKELFHSLPLKIDYGNSNISINKLIVSIAVIDICRQLRAGKKLNVGKIINKDLFSYRQKILIRHSKLSEKDAIKKIIEKLKTPLQVSRNYRPRDLIEVLITYGEKPLFKILENLKNNQGLNQYSIRYLIDYISLRTPLLSKIQTQNIIKILDSQKAILSKKPGLRSYIKYIKKDLQKHIEKIDD